jgi:AraC-like DNA-binding protein
MGNSLYEKKGFKTTAPIIVWHNDQPMFPSHWHDCFEILYIHKGSLQISLNGVVYEAGGEDIGNIVMVNSGVVHKFFDVKSKTVVSGLQFPITFFDECFIDLRDLVFQNPVIGKNNLGDAHYNRVNQLLQQIFIEYRNRSIGYQLAIKSLVYEFFLTILRNMPGSLNKIPSAKSKYICDYIKKNFDNPDLGLEETSSKFNLNKFYFSHFFKKDTGFTFNVYLSSIRVNYAKQKLLETDMSITDVAFHCGFNSLQTFNRVFKTLTGFTPKNYRHENNASVSLQNRVNET